MKNLLTENATGQIMTIWPEHPNIYGLGNTNNFFFYQYYENS